MSFSLTEVRCHGCNYEGVMPHGPVTLEYRLADGSVAFGYRRHVWCHACRDIRAAEEPLDPQQIAQELAELRRPKGFFSRLFGRKPDVAEQEKIDQMGALARLAQGRRSPPRCLECGATHIEALEFQNGTSQFKHACDKALFIVPEDPDAPRFMFAELVIPLDAEGNRLDRKPGPAPENAAMHALASPATPARCRGA